MRTDEEVKDILWSKDIEDMKNSWIDQGFSNEDAQAMAENMKIVEEENERRIEEKKIYTGLNSKGEMKEWKMIAWVPVIEDTELD